MINNKTIAVVIPAYNEEKQIKMVLESVPDFVDRIVVINDGSKDKTAKMVAEIIDSDSGDYSNERIGPIKLQRTRYNAVDFALKEQLELEDRYYNPSEIYNASPEKSRIILINHLKNGGVGAAVANGYKWCRDNQMDCVAKVDGDGQMDPAELEEVCKPVIFNEIDYVKGNRLIYPGAQLIIPKVRFFGNSVLSILTKVASGYWHVSDTQTAFTAISLRALTLIKLYKLYPRYGYPNDILVKLNVNQCTITEVPIKPVYEIGEQSKMNILKVIPRISGILIKGFFHRIWNKYLKKSFHPLFILYHFGMVSIFLSIPFLIKIMIRAFSDTDANPITGIAFVFLFITGFQAFLFAMWMDIQDNERLNK